mgnify:CR=1 FL=1
MIGHILILLYLIFNNVYTHFKNKNKLYINNFVLVF